KKTKFLAMTVEWERGGTPRGAALSPIVEPGKRISRHPALLKASRLSHAQAVARSPPATDSPAQTAGSPHRNLTLPAVGSAVGCAVSLSSPRSSGTLIPESLVRSHAARLNRRHEIILAAHRAARHPPQHGDLSHVRQRIRHRALKQPLGLGTQWDSAGQTAIECLQPRKESRGIRLPGPRLGIMPRLFSIRYRQRPVEQIANVRQNLPWRARTVSGKLRRRAT